VNGLSCGLTCVGRSLWTLTIAEDRTVEYNSLNDGRTPITSRSRKRHGHREVGLIPYTFGAQALFSAALDQDNLFGWHVDYQLSMS